jgi:hypothetical protein
MAEGDNGGSPNTSPYALYALLGIVVLATAVFLVVYLTGGLSGSILATSFGSLITLYGTLGGAYFGIKVTSDAANKNAAGGDRAENIAKEALVDLPSDQADRIRQRLSEL